jgi:hypothetical protein
VGDVLVHLHYHFFTFSADVHIITKNNLGLLEVLGGDQPLILHNIQNLLLFGRTQPRKLASTGHLIIKSIL